MWPSARSPDPRLLAAVALLGVAVGMSPEPGRSTEPPVSVLEAHLRSAGRPPLEYLLARLDTHRVVIVGEGHWLAQDVGLIAAVIPHLAGRGGVLAVEMFPAAQQENIDRLLVAPQWEPARANAILRAAAWPYREYRDLLQTAWEANRHADPGGTVRIIGLGPPEDWRQSLLPKGVTYESFMAERVLEQLQDGKGRVLVYCGMHHAFTRYHQAELDLGGRATAYMDRMGNILWRRLGERVFLMALHKPIWCGSPEKPTYCLPFGGRVDCAAARGGAPVGFDVVESPFADLVFSEDDYYARGHHRLRFADYTDGTIWTTPVEATRLVALIPLAEFAPDAESLAEVARHNPFSDEPHLPREKIEELWRLEEEASARPLAKRGWAHLADWRQNCPP